MENYIGIQWAWITLPVGTVMLTAIFLVAVIVSSRGSRMKVWKSSALAMLFQGQALSRDVIERWEQGGSALRGVYVRLDTEDQEGERATGLVSA